MVDTLLNYFTHSSAISIGVLVLLSFYFIIVFWIFFYKYFQLSSNIDEEALNLNSLVSRDGTIDPLSKLGKCINNTKISKELLNVCEISLVRGASKGLSGYQLYLQLHHLLDYLGRLLVFLNLLQNLQLQAK